jgi:type IV pilus assembly protein PilV
MNGQRYLRKRPSGPLGTRPRTARGAGLLEVLVALVLFSLGLLGMVAMQARATQMSVSAEDSGRATLLANELATQMWALNTVELPADQVEAWAARVANTAQGGLPNGEGSLTVSGNVARITIRWRPPHADAQAQNRFETDVIIARPGGTGTP